MDEIIGDSKNVKPAKKGRRAPAPAPQQADKDSTRESSVFKDEADETIDLFDSRKHSAAADNSSEKPSAKRGGWGADAETAAGDYEDERLRESSPVDDDSDTDIPVIPELEDEAIHTARGGDMVMAPHVAVNRVATFKELDTDLIRHTGFLSLKLQDGGEIDLKLLGEALSGENEVIEEDVAWEWEQVFTEVSSELLAEWERQEAVEQ